MATLSTKDTVNLTKELSEGFKRSAYWNSDETKPEKVIEKTENICELFNASFEGITLGYLSLLMFLLQVRQMMKET